jgi:hypothetical protein
MKFFYCNSIAISLWLLEEAAAYCRKKVNRGLLPEWLIAGFGKIAEFHKDIYLIKVKHLFPNFIIFSYSNFLYS